MSLYKAWKALFDVCCSGDATFILPDKRVLLPLRQHNVLLVVQLAAYHSQQSDYKALSQPVHMNSSTSLSNRTQLPTSAQWLRRAACPASTGWSCRGRSRVPSSPGSPKIDSQPHARLLTALGCANGNPQQCTVFPVQNSNHQARQAGLNCYYWWHCLVQPTAHLVSTSVCPQETLLWRSCKCRRHGHYLWTSLSRKRGVWRSPF